MSAQRFRRSALLPIATVLALLANGQLTCISYAQQVAEPLPEVISATVPFYPPIARAARIYGVVHLHLSTDGKRVSTIIGQTGPAMLIKSAEENVRTWIFAEYVPTSFDVSFRYNLLDVSKCETGNKPVVLHLPTEVEIDDSSQNCDTLRIFRNQKILSEQHAYAVELHIILNGATVEAPSEVVVSNGVRSVTLPVESGLFLVPDVMRTESDFTFRARIGQDQIEIPGIRPFELEESWTIVLADKDFGEDFDYAMPKGTYVGSACILALDPVDGDGIDRIVYTCRKPLSK